MNDFAIIFALASLGFFGGFTHCASMCSPFVLTQVTNNLSKIPLQKFSNFEKLKNFALLPYHFGRISTYCVIGFLCSFFTKEIIDFTQFKFLSSILLIFAALVFGSLALDIKFLENNFFAKKIKSITSNFICALPLQNLFQNPKGIKGYFLGVILGFIPCGLLYSAFLIACSVDSPIVAMLGMAAFGVATFPALFLSASGGYFLLKKSDSKFKLIYKIIALTNCAMLFLMAFKLF